MQVVYKKQIPKFSQSKTSLQRICCSNFTSASWYWEHGGGLHEAVQFKKIAGTGQKCFCLIN